jgi:hypothetical protein
VRKKKNFFVFTTKNSPFNVKKYEKSIFARDTDKKVLCGRKRAIDHAINFSPVFFKKQRC